VHVTAEAISGAGPRRRVSVGAIATFVVGVTFLTAIIHICTIQLVPFMAESDGWSRLSAVAGEDRFVEVPAVGAEGAVQGLDPLFVNAACRIRLDDAPVAIAVEARDRFWSLALLDPRGTIIFSLNDRTALAGRLDMLVVDPDQNTVLRASPPPGFDQLVVVESQSLDLIALIRLFAPTPSTQAEARRILAAAECVPEPLPEAPASG
jgi:uncharacterized membrane protein